MFEQALFGHNGEAGSGAAWSPAVDVRETENGIMVSTELPGLKSEDVNITVENGVLSISGERKQEWEEKDGESHMIERQYGRFERSFRLPRTVDTEKVSAKLENGVLNIELPRSDTARPRQVEIK
jgi:HSP20 family protein